MQERNQIKVSNTSRLPHQETASTTDSSSVPVPGISNSSNKADFLLPTSPQPSPHAFQACSPPPVPLNPYLGHFSSLPEGSCLQSSSPFFSDPHHPIHSYTTDLAPKPPFCPNSLHLCTLVPLAVPWVHVKSEMKETGGTKWI